MPANRFPLEIGVADGSIITIIFLLYKQGLPLHGNNVVGSFCYFFSGIHLANPCQPFQKDFWGTELHCMVHDLEVE